MFNIILISNIFATLFMTGLIWFIQIVQYPGFQQIQPENFLSYHLFHISHTGFVVIPPMIIELGTSIWLTISFEQYWMYNALGLAIVTTIWISTFFLQLPLHRQLQKELSQKMINKLIATNWIRTVLWSLKAGVSVYLIFLMT